MLHHRCERQDRKGRGERVHIRHAVFILRAPLHDASRRYLFGTELRKGLVANGEGVEGRGENLLGREDLCEHGES